MRRKILGLLGLLVVLVASFWGLASAQDFRSGTTTNVGAGETVSSSLWISGRTINIAGTVRGDVFCAGQNVTISGTIQGDLLCAAQTINISGAVTGDIRVAAQTATLSGAVSHNASILAQTFSQEPKSAIGDDASIAANDVSLNGAVGRDVAIASSTAFLNGRVGRNVQADTQSLSLGGSTNIVGNLNYTSPNNAKLATGATVQGHTTKSSPKKSQGVNLAGVRFGFAIYMLVASLLVALVLVLLFPHALRAVAMHGLRMPWKSLLVGLIAAIVVPVIIMLAFVTVIGIPFGLLILAAWLVLDALAFVASAFYLGRIVWRRQHNAVVAMLIGTIILVILIHLPFIGWIFWILAGLLGTGMILLELGRHWSKPHYNLDTQPVDKRS